MWKVVKIIKKGDYLYCITEPAHPKATKNKYVLHHRVVMENHLGRTLQSQEVVHHINGDKKDNRVANLEVMTKAKHSVLHGLAQGYKMVDLVCPQCGKKFTKPKRSTHLNKPGQNKTFCSRTCNGRFSREVQLHGVTHRMEDAISGNIVRVYDSR